MAISKESYGKSAGGKAIDIYTMTNTSGMKARVINYGAILVSLEIPDREGQLADITLGFEKLEGWLGEHPYFGASIGRFGNRLAHGKFSLNGKEYRLAQNNGPNHLHGGLKGFDKVVWTADKHETKIDNNVILTYLSPDGEEGYPGNLQVKIIYTLTKDNELKISYEATTDAPTIVNLTHHSYFNLAGQGQGDILSHEMMINADKYLPVNQHQIPRGLPETVKGTPMDFTSTKRIGSRIHQVEGGGYDHNYCLNKTDSSLTLAAQVSEPKTGRVMELYTTEPGMQFYTGNFLDGTITGKEGRVYNKHYGFCLETQHYPDSPNQWAFPSTVLNPGQTYRQLTVHKFFSK